MTPCNVSINFFSRHRGLLVAVAAFLFILPHSLFADQPNIVVLMADDLGYGDVQPLNPDSKIATPAFNRLAANGLTFTDAHTPSAVCTPTRYGLLCGRYAWRTRLTKGVLGGYSKPLIGKDDPTIASVLKTAGYQTSCVGKWHLGLGWVWGAAEPKNINNFGIAGKRGDIDYTAALTDAPVHHGFDQSFIIAASLDMSPYVYIENDRVTSIPQKIIASSSFPKFYRKGEIAEDFRIVDVLDTITEQATTRILELSKSDQPYFLYVPLPAPHKPVYPKEAFAGKSGLGPYGDFIMQVDEAVGKIHSAIRRSGEEKNTLFIVTSDNGSFMHTLNDKSKPDHVVKESVQGFHADNHRANGNLKGTKADIWEAGHRVPFFVSWPEKIEEPGKIHNAICHTDLLATCAEFAGVDFDEVFCQDSFSWAGLLDSKSTNYSRPPIVHHSVSGMFAIRQGRWKMICGRGSGGRMNPRSKPFEKPFMLYDLSTDLSETTDVASQHPDIVAEMTKQLELIRTSQSQ